MHGDRDIFPCGCTDFASAAVAVHQPCVDTAADVGSWIRDRRAYQRADSHTAPKRYAVACADADLHADRYPNANANADLWRTGAADLDCADCYRDAGGAMYSYRQQKRQPAEWAID